jgi:hypothetical protein
MFGLTTRWPLAGLAGLAGLTELGTSFRATA